MKALYYCIGISLVLGLASCGQREAEQAQKAPVQEQEKEYRVHFTTGTVETKTTFGDAVDDGAGHVTYPAYWTANDRSVMISLNYEQAVTAGVDADKTDGDGHIIRASFDASFTGIEASNPYRFYLVSPASAFMWPSATRSGVSFFVPGTQKPTAASVDEAAQILVARSDAYTAMPEAVEVDFDHITAYGKLTLNNVNPGTGVSVESVTLWSENQSIAGSWYYKFSDGSIQEKEPSGSLEINTENINVVAGDPIWFACAPAGLGGKPLKIAVNLSNGKALVRTITLNSTVNFAAGKIIRFSVNMASATLEDRAAATDAPVLAFSDYGAFLLSQNLVYNSTTDQLSREYAADGTVTFAIVAPAEIQTLEFSGIPADAMLGDAFTLHLTYVSGNTTEIDDVSYSVTVVREDGPKLWLADAAGNGFIVKR